MAVPRSRADLPGIAIWENAPLPKLPDIFCGIYVRAGAEVEEREQICRRDRRGAAPASRDRSIRSRPAALGGLIS